MPKKKLEVQLPADEVALPADQINLLKAGRRNAITNKQRISVLPFMHFKWVNGPVPASIPENNNPFLSSEEQANNP